MSDSAGEPQSLDEKFNAAQSLDEKLSAAQELQRLKKLIESAEDEKSRLTLEKLASDSEKKKAQTETESWIDSEDKCAEQFRRDLEEIQEELENLDRVTQDLKREYKDLEKKLQLKRAETDSLQQRFKIKAEIPVKRVKFTHSVEEEQEDQEEHVESVFTVTQRPSYLLKGGHALITFEEEKVSEQILRLAKCSVSCDKTKMDVKPYALTLDPSVKFEVHIKVSKKTVKFRNAPPTLPEERMRDRLELSFSRASRGGGEVENVQYDKQNGTGHVTFLNTGVAENLALRGKFCVDTDSDMLVDVLPLYQYQLKKFQTYSGVPNRTVLLGGIQDVIDEEDIQDHLEIHFQKPSNYGGEVESIKYVPSGKQLMAFFSEDNTDTDA
ncbi:N-myc-interactor-like isoform X2 [Myxocyprinus asiaticus]|uniref:N-myc-interactor-like isoform X2 n=1 Tax=Myxocyprinus asiaticus TaxID=70543 RepID=UPI0022215899|nr:N-myc-interactor-like isoform X2 [Myxocyprinus asiaticus]